VEDAIGDAPDAAASAEVPPDAAAIPDPESPADAPAPASEDPAEDLLPGGPVGSA